MSTLPPASDEADRLADRLDDLTAVSRSFGSAITAAFKGAVVQGRELDSVLRGLVTRISNAALDRALQPIANGIAGGLETALRSALNNGGTFRLGGVFEGGRVQPFANGGVVARPSYFPLADGRTGLMGEAGAEAIMPLRRGPDGRLGVAAAGGGGPVNVTFNVSTPDVEGFRRSEAQIKAVLARAVGRGRRGL